MDAKNFLRIKPKRHLASQPAVQPLANPELETPSQLQPELVEPSQTQELANQTKQKPDSELQIPPPVGYLDLATMIEREESIGGSGWGYSQLLKEFRE